ncbi:MAG: hypothetical protein DRP63_02240, partial [Planctomycetota bacterium]
TPKRWTRLTAQNKPAPHLRSTCWLQAALRQHLMRHTAASLKKSRFVRAVSATFDVQPAFQL